MVVVIGGLITLQSYDPSTYVSQKQTLSISLRKRKCLQVLQAVKAHSTRLAREQRVLDIAPPDLYPRVLGLETNRMSLETR